ncbi:MAG: hypothetical protein IJB69_01360 [Clostridia bacterium]|nr:hypothetical protein [Clostridia bacterium]
MMKINIRSQTLDPMLDWLKTAREQNVRNEARLREILQMEDYRIEFARYGMEGLPVCGISFEEAIDFFLNFDRKEFSNPRLQAKKESFLKFYENMDASLKTMDLFSSFSEAEIAHIEKLLANGLPDELLCRNIAMNIILIVSIGNSFGWPYENYIDFDVANLCFVHSKKELLHLIAHEIYHTFFDALIPNEMKPEEFFLLNFAFEGLAVHFTNNQPTVNKPAKYPGDVYCMEAADMTLYEAEFDELFAMLQEDLNTARTLSVDQVAELVGSHYERFSYRSPRSGKEHAISQYPTYYLGCYLFGLIDHVLGKERLFEALKHPERIIDTYNEAVRLTASSKLLA